MTTLRRLAVILSALVALGITPTHALPLGGLGLQVRDLRPGYVLASAVYHPESFVAGDYHVAFARLVHFGWRASFEQVFTRRDGSITDEVGNKLDQYRGPVGAQWGYRVAVQNVLCCGKYHSIAMPLVGQASTGFAGNGFIGIKFRRGHFVADVAILPSNRIGSLLLLARRLDARLSTYR